MAEIYTTQRGAQMPQSAAAQIDRTTAEVVGGGASIAAICGLGAIVLGILGLAGMLPTVLCGVAVLAAGVSLVFEGGSIAARFENIRTAIAINEGRREVGEVEAGITVEMMGGLGAIVLGILSLIGIVPLTLLPVAAIVLGSTLLLGSSGTFDAIELPTKVDEATQTPHLARRTASATAGVDILVGLAGVALGIIGLIAGHATPILSLIALLVIGAAELLTDSTLAMRMTSMFSRR